MLKIELLMRITTLVKNYFAYVVLLVSLFGNNISLYSQCPTVTNATQSFCDIQSPTIASLVAHNPTVGVKVYVWVPSVVVEITAGDQVPVIPFVEVVGKVPGVAF